MSQYPDMVNIIPPSAIIVPENRVHTVFMTTYQYEEMIYCVDQVQRNRRIGIILR